MKSQEKTLVGFLAREEIFDGMDETYKEFVLWARDILERNSRSNQIRPEGEGQSNQIFTDEEWQKLLEEQCRRPPDKWLEI